MKQTIAKISSEALKLEEVLRSIAPNEFISYSDLEIRSGVTMNAKSKGRGYLRTAANRLKLDYTCIRGEGIELAGEHNISDMIVDSVVKIDNSVKRASKRVKRASKSEYFSKIEDTKKKDILCVGSMLETLAAQSKGAKLFFKKPVIKALNS